MNLSLHMINFDTNDTMNAFDFRGLRALTLDAQKHSEEMLTPSSSDSMDSINECLKSPFSLQNECELDKEEEITNCVEANDGKS